MNATIYVSKGLKNEISKLKYNDDDDKSGGDFPDEPNFHEQGRLQDHHQWHHDLPGHNHIVLLRWIIRSISDVCGEKFCHVVKSSY